MDSLKLSLKQFKFVIIIIQILSVYSIINKIITLDHRLNKIEICKKMKILISLIFMEIKINISLEVLKILKLKIMNLLYILLLITIVRVLRLKMTK